jgi:glycosyltransferase involved in cell wall biosynthesis
MPNINFLLIGDGVLKKRCKAELDKSSMNGRFIFTGWRRDVSDILDIIDIVVLTSKWEGLPIAIIEALSKGKPIVATDVGGIRELLKDRISGYITKPGKYKDVANRILDILKDKDLFFKMREEADKSIDDSFDINAMAYNIDNLYRNLA